MSRVYSNQLALLSLPSGFSELFAVPDGFVAVVRSIDVFNNTGTGPEGVDPFIVYANGLPIWGSGRWFPMSYVNYQWRGRQVLDAEQTLEWVSESSLWNVWVSGYLLALP